MNEERFNHLRLNEITVKGVELREPKLVAVVVAIRWIGRVAAQVTEVLPSKLAESLERAQKMGYRRVSWICGVAGLILRECWRPVRESNPCRRCEEKRPTVIQRNLAAWIALYRT